MTESQIVRIRAIELAMQFSGGAGTYDLDQFLVWVGIMESLIVSGAHRVIEARKA